MTPSVFSYDSVEEGKDIKKKHCDRVIWYILFLF